MCFLAAAGRIQAENYQGCNWQQAFSKLECLLEKSEYDAVVVGSGPNGLAAALEIARTGRSVAVIEAHETIGGGMRTGEVTLPGFLHDICSSVHPLGIASPFFRSVNLSNYGLEWVHPRYCAAHPFDDGSAAVLDRSVDVTAESLGDDARAYHRTMDPWLDVWEFLLEELLGPFPLPPRRPFLLARFGLQALPSAQTYVNRYFKGERAKAFFAGMAAHSIQPLENIVSASFGLMLSLLGHVVGWPVARGGSQSLANALAGELTAAGVKICTGWKVNSLDELPPSRAVLLDVTPRQVLDITGERFPDAYRRQLGRYRDGPGIFKIDWALSEPVPWRAEECRQAGTVHLGGTYEEIALSERLIGQGKHPEKPFVLFVQPSRFDRSRAPEGKEVGWAYCHVPNGSTVDMTDRIEAQIERFAPGFKDCILARRVWSTRDLESYNPNYIGGDINGGMQDLLQFFTRPTLQLTPYRTPDPGIYICSSSTPPGGGVHGMCGYHAARTALRYAFNS